MATPASNRDDKLYRLLVDEIETAARRRDRTVARGKSANQRLRNVQ